METSLKKAVNAEGKGFHTAQKKLLNKIASSNPKVYYVTADAAPASTTPATISSLSFPINRNTKYLVEGHFPCLGDGTSGIAANLATTNDPTDARIVFSYQIDNAAAQLETQTDLTSPNPTGVAAAITLITFAGNVFAGVNDDTCHVQFSTFQTTTAAAVYKGGFIKVYEVE